jgi:hypothetical protein
MKNFGLWTFITLFVILALANMPMVQGMPFTVQLSYFANEALWYMQQAAEPFVEFVRSFQR